MNGTRLQGMTRQVLHAMEILRRTKSGRRRRATPSKVTDEADFDKIERGEGSERSKAVEQTTFTFPVPECFLLLLEQISLWYHGKGVKRRGSCLVPVLVILTVIVVVAVLALRNHPSSPAVENEGKSAVHDDLHDAERQLRMLETLCKQPAAGEWKMDEVNQQVYTFSPVCRGADSKVDLGLVVSRQLKWIVLIGDSVLRRMYEVWQHEAGTSHDISEHQFQNDAYLYCLGGNCLADFKTCSTVGTCDVEDAEEASLLTPDAEHVMHQKNGLVISFHWASNSRDLSMLINALTLSKQKPDSVIISFGHEYISHNMPSSEFLTQHFEPNFCRLFQLLGSSMFTWVTIPPLYSSAIDPNLSEEDELVHNYNTAALRYLRELQRLHLVYVVDVYNIFLQYPGASPADEGSETTSQTYVASARALFYHLTATQDDTDSDIEGARRLVFSSWVNRHCHSLEHIGGVGSNATAYAEEFAQRARAQQERERSAGSERSNDHFRTYGATSRTPGRPVWSGSRESKGAEENVDLRDVFYNSDSSKESEEERARRIEAEEKAAAQMEKEDLRRQRESQERSERDEVSRQRKEIASALQGLKVRKPSPRPSVAVSEETNVEGSDALPENVKPIDLRENVAPSVSDRRVGHSRGAINIRKYHDGDSKHEEMHKQAPSIADLYEKEARSLERRPYCADPWMGKWRRNVDGSKSWIPLKCELLSDTSHLRLLAKGIKWLMLVGDEYVRSVFEGVYSWAGLGQHHNVGNINDVVVVCAPDGRDFDGERCAYFERSCTLSKGGSCPDGTLFEAEIMSLLQDEFFVVSWHWASNDQNYMRVLDSAKRFEVAPSVLVAGFGLHTLTRPKRGVPKAMVSLERALCTTLSAGWIGKIPFMWQGIPTLVPEKMPPTFQKRLKLDDMMTYNDQVQTLIYDIGEESGLKMAQFVDAAAVTEARMDLTPNGLYYSGDYNDIMWSLYLTSIVEFIFAEQGPVGSAAVQFAARCSAHQSVDSGL